MAITLDPGTWIPKNHVTAKELLFGSGLSSKFKPSGRCKMGSPDYLPALLAPLLRPIARRMRQRLQMFFKPNPIAHVDIAAAERATFEMFGFAQ
jgi:hypothetical protein